MKHIELENELNCHIRKRRIISCVIGAVFLVIAIVFSVAYVQSRTVNEIDLGPINYEIVTYNHDLAFGILIGWLGLLPCVALIILDRIRSKPITVNVGGDYITLYRGLLSVNLYVNGEYKDGLSFGYHLEAPLSDGSRVSVALGKWSAYMTFSNGHPSIKI